MARLNTGAASEALAILVTVVAGCTREALGELKDLFQRRMRAAMAAVKTGLDIMAGGDMPQGCLIMNEGWKHLVGTVRDIEVGRLHSLWVPGWDVRTKPEV